MMRALSDVSSVRWDGLWLVAVRSDGTETRHRFWVCQMDRLGTPHVLVDDEAQAAWEEAERAEAEKTAEDAVREGEGDRRLLSPRRDGASDRRPKSRRVRDLAHSVG